MHTIKDVKAKFPEAYSCGGELIARIDNENVVLASLGAGSFNLTAKGLELMGAEPVVEAPKEVKEPKAPKAPKAKKPEPVKEPEVQPTTGADELADILGE